MYVGGLCQGVLGFGQPDPVERLGRRDGHRERPRIGVPDVLGRRDDQAPGDELGVLAGRDHRRQPVQRGVGVVAAQALDERGDRVVVTVAGAVVAEDPLLCGRLHVLEPRGDPALLVPDALRLGEGNGAFEHVERRPRIAAGERHEVIEGLVGHGNAAAVLRAEGAGKTPFRVADRATDDGRDVLVGERFEPPDPHPRQERGVDLEVGILGRRTDQRDRAVLDVRQQGILLRLVEAVDLVEEQDRALAVEREPLLRLGDRGPDVGDTGHHRAHRRELGADLRREQPGQAGLARARRSPQQQRREVAAGDAPPQRSALADEVFLPDELLEVPRAHPGRERLALGRGLEERLGSGAGNATCWHAASLGRPTLASATCTA